MPVKGAPLVLRSHFGLASSITTPSADVVWTYLALPRTLCSTYDRVRIPLHHELTPVPYVAGLLSSRTGRARDGEGR